MAGLRGPFGELLTEMGTLEITVFPVRNIYIYMLKAIKQFN